MSLRKDDPEYDRWLDEIVSLTEAAALRKVSVETLRNLVRKDRLRAIQISDRKRGMTRREATRTAPQSVGSGGIHNN